MNASALRVRFSKSVARRRQRLNQAKVRSTIHRFGKTSVRTARSDRFSRLLKKPVQNRKFRLSAGEFRSPEFGAQLDDVLLPGTLFRGHGLSPAVAGRSIQKQTTKSTTG
jgi:hypothetical protein